MTAKQPDLELISPEPPRPCRRCDGEGTVVMGEGWEEQCFVCDSDGTVHPPKWDELLRLIVVRRGGKITLRAGRPGAPTPGDGLIYRRAYYLWRLARFHGGADTHMPVMAEIDVDGDPFYEELAEASARLAEHFFGTSMGAASQWSIALLGRRVGPEGPVEQPEIDGRPVVDWLVAAS